MNDVDAVVCAVRDGNLAVVPTDTVYGLVCTAFDERPAAALYRLKGRESIQPTSVLAAGVDVLFEWLPDLPGRVADIARALFPGPFTLVVPNPARRFGWLCEGTPETIGVRVPALTGSAADIVDRLGLVVATSANLAGGPDPRRLVDVPDEILAGVAVAVDGGELPGIPSTVIDVTGPEPTLRRAGAGDPLEALARIAGRLT